MKKFNDTFMIIGALVVGALVGGAVAVLFAPEKGSDLRAKLAEGAKDTAEDLINKMREEANALLERADELKNLAEIKFDNAMNIIKNKQAV